MLVLHGRGSAPEVVRGELKAVRDEFKAVRDELAASEQRLAEGGRLQFRQLTELYRATLDKVEQLGSTWGSAST
jgi:uncharacterized protein (DUF3084 family)